MKKFATSIIILISLVLVGCTHSTDSNSNSTKTSEAGQSQTIGEILNKDKRTIWYSTNDGANKDAVIDKIYISQSGKITTYVVSGLGVESDTKLTLGNITSLTDKEIIAKAKKANTLSSKAELENIISMMTTLIESGEKSLENTDTLVDGNYSETLYHTGGEKTKEEIISESQTGITEAKTKVKELKQLNTKNHEMFNRSPLSFNINLTTDSSGNNIKNESLSITNAIFNSGYAYSNLKNIGNYTLNYDKIDLDSTINFEIYDSHYSGYRVNNNTNNLFITRVNSSDIFFNFDDADTEFDNITIN